MKPWAKKFYASKAWIKCRLSYIEKVFGLCERCGKPGKIVHHTVYLTPDNINDPDVSLNHRLLEYLCQDCHNGEHHGTVEPLVEAGLMFDPSGDLVQAPPLNSGGYDVSKTDVPHSNNTQVIPIGGVVPRERGKENGKYK